MKEHVAEIVVAFVKRNQVPAPELPTLIASVSQSLTSLGQAPTAAPNHSVALRSVTPHYCMPRHARTQSTRGNDRSGLPDRRPYPAADLADGSGRSPDGETGKAKEGGDAGWVGEEVRSGGSLLPSRDKSQRLVFKMRPSMPYRSKASSQAVSSSCESL
jgi:hypothetical protein